MRMNDIFVKEVYEKKIESIGVRERLTVKSINRVDKYWRQLAGKYICKEGVPEQGDYCCGHPIKENSS